MNPDRMCVREAFDRHADVYDQRFSKSFLAQEIRAEIWQIAGGVFSRGMRVLDLGCGTGEDAIHFAQEGIEITAVDLSPAMVAQLRLKARAGIRCEVAEMESYTPNSGLFDGIFSNFGALNCTSDLAWLRRLAVGHMKCSGHLVLTMMGRFYPLESAVFLLKGKPGLAFRRLGNHGSGRIEGVSFPVHYHSPRAIQQAIGSEFDLVELRGFRSLVPAPGWEHLARFRSLRLLECIDRWMTRQSLTACWADHFVSVWRHREK